MKGYIYITGQGADPALNSDMKDPIFGKPPTLGGCMPNIRRNVIKGDWIFVVSGKTAGVQQYIVGGLRVEEKISALAAYETYPENRLGIVDGRLVGNVLIDETGAKHQLDRHNSDGFEKRLENYIVGSQAVVLTSEAEVQRAREETLKVLGDVVGKPAGNRVVDTIGRGANRLDEAQVNKLLGWLNSVKSSVV